MPRARFQRRFRDRCRATLTWLALPLVFWNARPAAGCICADGTLQPHCKSAFFTGLGFAATQAGGGCTCCRGTDANGAALPSCQHGPTQPPTDDGRASVHGKSCCSGMVPAWMVQATERGSLRARHGLRMDWTGSLCDQDAAHAAGNQRSALHGGQLRGSTPIACSPPLFDRVVTLCRLVI